MKRYPKSLLVVLLSTLAVLAGTAKAAEVTVGYQLTYGPWKTQMQKIKKDGHRKNERSPRRVSRDSTP